MLRAVRYERSMTLPVLLAAAGSMVENIEGIADLLAYRGVLLPNVALVFVIEGGRR